MKRVLQQVDTTALDQALQELAQQYPGLPSGRQPVHTVYGGAQLYKAGASKKLGDLALRSLNTYAADAAEFGQLLGLVDAEKIHARVINKLQTEAIEDQRIDFEDGYGNRPDDEEDAHALGAAEALAEGMSSKTLPPFCGIRIKSFSTESKDRAIRSLDLFMTRLAECSDAQVPEQFVITLPKVTLPEQVSTLVQLLGQLESQCGYASNSLQLEIMIETTQAIVNADGRVPLRALTDAADGRCVAAHFGTYDYTAACDITAAEQTHDHPAADFARSMLQACYAGSNIRLSDGATTQMPVAVHRGSDLSAAQQAENRQAVHQAWQQHFNNITRSLQRGFYQSWDLNPAQLPIRYAAVYNFFLSGYADAASRLSSFINKAAQANLVGSTFDDAATGQGLLNYFLRGLACGALTEDEVLATGITLAELNSRSFAQIVRNRSQ